MCLATVYKESDDTVICRNVSKILVEGEKVIIRDIMGEVITEPESPLSVPCSSILVYLLLLLFSNFTNPSCVVAATTASQAPSEVNSSKFVAFSRAKRFKTTWKGLSLLCRRYIPLGLTTRRT